MSRNSRQIHNEIHCKKHDNVVRKTITYCNTYFCQYVINKDSVEYCQNRKRMFQSLLIFLKVKYETIFKTNILTYIRLVPYP